MHSQLYHHEHHAIFFLPTLTMKKNDKKSLYIKKDGVTNMNYDLDYNQVRGKRDSTN
jgi:hypothetical protein